MNEIIKWCEENGFQLYINPNDFAGNCVTFKFTHHEDHVIPDFSIARTIDKRDLFYHTKLDENDLYGMLLEHIKREWANYKKVEAI